MLFVTIGSLWNCQISPPNGNGLGVAWPAECSEDCWLSKFCGLDIAY